MKVDSSKTESRAISAIRNLLDPIDSIDPSGIAENDRGPSFDGYISIRSGVGSPSLRFANVQIKGRAIQDISEAEVDYVAFPIRTYDLKNYQDNGGVLFFLVQILDGRGVAVFYADLLPMGLTPILRSKGEQETITWKLYPIPSSPAEVEDLILNHCLHSERQRSFAANGPVDISKMSVSSIEIPFISSNTSAMAFMRSLPGRIAFEYARIEGLENILLPVSAEERIETVCEIVNQPFVIDGVEFYSSYQIRHTTHGSQVLLGNLITIDIDPTRTEKALLSIQSKARLSEQLQAIRFVAFAHHRNEQIGAYEANANSHDDSWINKRSAFVNHLSDLLSRLGCNQDPMVDLDNGQDIAMAENLYKAIVLEQPVENPNGCGEPGLWKYSFMGLTFLLLSYPETNNTYRLYDLFSLYATAYVNTSNDDKALVPLITHLSPELLGELSNLRAAAIKDDLKRIPWRDDIIDTISLIQINLLNAYDSISTGELLNCEKVLFEWCNSNCKSEQLLSYILANHCQALRRTGSVDIALINRFSSLLSHVESMDEVNLLTIALEIIDGQFDEAREKYSALDEGKKVMIRDYPIGSLWRKTDDQCPL